MLLYWQSSMCQNYFFSNGNVWIWELDQKEIWAPKNWCFWIIVLEKTLESPLDSKEIKWVNSEGNKPWIFIGSSVQSLSSVRLFATPWITARQASLSITNSRTSHRLTSIESVMPSSHLILVPFLSWPQPLPESESFPMSQPFTWSSQSTGVSVLASFLPKKSQGWSPLE